MEPGGGHHLWLDLVLLGVVLPVAVIDLRRRLIPNVILLPAATAALAVLALTSPHHLAQHAAAAAAAGGFLLVPAVARPAAMGMGDVKLAAVMGLCLGRSVAVAMLCALLAGTVAGVVIIARRGVREGRRASIPFGPFLAAGAVIGILPGPALLGW
jgi:leader peptidase (prepilin peptidase) / N-methyltransferase